MALGELAPQRAGSGSALLQALRQAAGTIGVAVLGTVLTTQYRADLGPYDSQPIAGGVSTGVALARKLGDPRMLERVRAAFVGGMGTMLWACAAICLFCGISVITAIGSKTTRDTSKREQQQSFEPAE